MQKQIEHEIEKLFLYQGFPLKPDQKEALAFEISAKGYPMGAIMAGLADLMAEDLTRVKLVTILNAIKKRIEPERVVRCGFCSGSGLFVMKDIESRRFGLACRCGNGSPAGVQWNGLDVQYSRGRELVAAYSIQTFGDQSHETR